MNGCTESGSNHVHDADSCLLWQPKFILETQDNNSNADKYCIMILNRPINLNAELFLSLWNNAFIRYTVDGGTTRFLNLYQKQINPGQTMKCPDIASGDFDSITPEAMQFLTQLQSVEIIRTPNQDETDFTKALKELIKTPRANLDIRSVVAIVESSGRMDHIMGNINTLFKSHAIIPNATVYLMSSCSLTWLLKPGIMHRIEIPQFIVSTKRWCSLVPIGQQPAVVTTTGLKWNLKQSKLEFGGMVSTSNTYSDNVVTIVTDNYVLWSMGTFKNPNT